jgi:hypothetical protein
MNISELRDWFNRTAYTPGKMNHKFSHRVLKDNRTRFRELWGKPSYCYRGHHDEFYCHCWLLDLDGQVLILAFTAKGRGSSYELVEKLNGKPVIGDFKTVKKFFEEVV